MTEGFLCLLNLFSALMLLGLGELYLFGWVVIMTCALAVVEPRKALCLATWLLTIALLYLGRWEIVVFGAMVSAAYIAAVVWMKEL